MINNAQAKRLIAQKWEAVRKIERSLSIQPIVPGTGIVDMSAPIESYNLPFVLAYAVLDDVLSQLHDQGEFRCSSREPMLREKMCASRNILPWQDYGFVDLGRKDRNKLAHEAKLVPKPDCIAYVDAIETELKAWGVLL